MLGHALVFGVDDLEITQYSEYEFYVALPPNERCPFKSTLLECLLAAPATIASFTTTVWCKSNIYKNQLPPETQLAQSLPATNGAGGAVLFMIDECPNDA